MYLYNLPEWYTDIAWEPSQLISIVLQCVWFQRGMRCCKNISLPFSEWRKKLWWFWKARVKQFGMFGPLPNFRYWGCSKVWGTETPISPQALNFGRQVSRLPGLLPYLVLPEAHHGIRTWWLRSMEPDAWGLLFILQGVRSWCGPKWLENAAQYLRRPKWKFWMSDPYWDVWASIGPDFPFVWLRSSSLGTTRWT